MHPSLERYNDCRTQYARTRDKVKRARLRAIMDDAWHNYVRECPKTQPVTISPYRSLRAWFNDRVRFGPTAIDMSRFGMPAYMEDGNVQSDIRFDGWTKPL